ncbi:uncharacterized protein E6C27_scaffold131G00900 [Cucumis melo var. makuwa]|uniref:Uncharacterized protein n=1 Tax=Cucumis melo var. makuwa TaxID=1194695 RepID=A0A5A7UKU8_CUCMM|nr:uncharacterized protein E6C27_scaffold131G00900 [Cucumis melo var. makuwa]
MAQKRIEEKLEAFDQDISEIRVELHKLPTIEENLSSTAKSIERLGIQAEKQQQQQQLLLKYIEGMVKEKSTMIEGIEGSSSKGRPVESVLEGSDATMKDTKLEVKMSKIEEEEYLND